MAPFDSVRTTVQEQAINENKVLTLSANERICPKISSARLGVDHGYLSIKILQ